MASKQVKGTGYFEIASEIGDKILMDLSAKKDFDNGLSHGDIGSLYFLLSLIDPVEKQESLLCPFSSSHGMIQDLQKPGFSVATVRRHILNKHFYKTCQILDHVTPEINKEFFTAPIDYNYNEINIFVSFIESFLDEVIESPIGLPLIDIYNLEKNKYKFLLAKCRTRAQIYIEDYIRHGKMIELINAVNNKLLDIEIIRSDKVMVIATKWNWSGVDESFKKEELIHNLSKIPASFETMLNITEHNELVETILKNEEPFCWHWFENKSTIRQVLEEVRHYHAQLNDEEMKANIEHFGSKSYADFQDTLQYLHLSKIKEWLYDGVLIIV